MYYYISGTKLGILRQELSQINYIAKSSVYSRDGFYYTIIQCSYIISWLREIELATDDILFSWAISEITQSPKFIYYESEAIDKLNYNQLHCRNQIICRLYQPLGEIMYIVNNTPNSFSESGANFNNYTYIKQHILNALKSGITLIDIGAQATNPTAQLISTDEEITRLEQVFATVRTLRQEWTFSVSLDSFVPEVIDHFWQDIDLINDVSSALPTQLLQKIAKSAKKYLFMHNLGIPANSNNTLSNNINPCETLLSWGQVQIEKLLNIGFTQQQIIFDVGIGFGKNKAQSWHILRNINYFKQLGVEILVGHSRKSFLNKICDTPYIERDLFSAAIASLMLHKNVDYVRMHDYQQLLLLNSTFNQLI